MTVKREWLPHLDIAKAAYANECKATCNKQHLITKYFLSKTQHNPDSPDNATDCRHAAFQPVGGPGDSKRLGRYQSFYFFDARYLFDIEVCRPDDQKMHQNTSKRLLISPPIFRMFDLSQIQLITTIPEMQSCSTYYTTIYQLFDPLKGTTPHYKFSAWPCKIRDFGIRTFVHTHRA